MLAPKIGKMVFEPTKEKKLIFVSFSSFLVLKIKEEIPRKDDLGPFLIIHIYSTLF